MVLRHLSDLEQSQFSFILNQSSSLDISSGLVSDFHDELLLLRHAKVQNVKINSGSHVVNIGHKDIFATLIDQFIKQS